MTYLDQLLGDIKQKIKKNSILQKLKNTAVDESEVPDENSERSAYQRIG